MEKFKSKGNILFGYSKNNILIAKMPYYEEKEIDIYGDLMSGKEFYECVDSCCIMDDDGVIGYVFVDGYESNLGLSHSGLTQGNFLVVGDTWLELCDEYNIVVEWCNK